MVSTHLKSISQIGSSPQVGVNMEQNLKPPPSCDTLRLAPTTTSIKQTTKRVRIVLPVRLLGIKTASQSRGTFLHCTHDLRSHQLAPALAAIDTLFQVYNQYQLAAPKTGIHTTIQTIQRQYDHRSKCQRYHRKSLFVT